MSYEEEDTCHMRRRIHACHMRRRIHRNQKEQQKLQGGGGTCIVAPTTIVLAPLALPSAMSARELLLLPTEALLPVTDFFLSRMELLPKSPKIK
jgi:hypothetical protein